MKQLIQPIYQENIRIYDVRNNFVIKEKQHKRYLQTKYCEQPRMEIKYIKGIDEILPETYRDICEYSKSKYISFNIYSITEYKILNTDDFTLQYLLNKLSANDMIEYMKDKGMVYCPMTK